MPLGSIGLFTLPREECLDLLRQVEIGRIVLTIKALPIALPVHYRLIGDDIVFACGAGSKLDAALADTVIGFEVDNIDQADGMAWSVLAVGRSRVVVDHKKLAAIEEANLVSWLPGPVARYIAIYIEVLSGRRLHPPLR